MKQYEMSEMCFSGPVRTDRWAGADVTAVFICGTERVQVKGFYAGMGLYKVRFLPERAGTWTWKVSGCVSGEGVMEVEAGEKHGPVRVVGHHFAYADGTPFRPFGTTVYALVHQEDALVEQTLRTLAASPFNKVRLCLFPKHYDYNHNEPPCYPFQKRPDGTWDAGRPEPAFWERFEGVLKKLDELGIQADLILFHPYDRWGFKAMSREDNLTYLDEALRRLSAFPNVWWSLANEYDLCWPEKEAEDFAAFEAFIARNDPVRHLMSNHHCFTPWDYSRKAITHVSYQCKSVRRVGEWVRRWEKPVCVDECCYEGNLPHTWGNLTGREMVSRFWDTMVQGGYCTHGETFLNPEEIVWWSRGGVLRGESPERIAFLRRVMEELPGMIEPSPSFTDAMDALTPERFEEQTRDWPDWMRALGHSFMGMDLSERAMIRLGDHIGEGHVGDEVFLTYLTDFAPVEFWISLPEKRTYRVEVIDPWEMTRTTVLTGQKGRTRVPLPGRAGLVIAAYAEEKGHV